MANSPGIRFCDRVLVVGQNGGGKSTLVNHLLGGFRCQRLIVDTKGHEWNVRGVQPVSDVAAIDWREPVIHYVDRTGSVAEYDELFAAAMRRRNLLICVHELADLCENNAQRTPPAVKRYFKKGRSLGLGVLGASQRPVEMPVVARTEANHLLVMVPPVLSDDLAVIAPTMGLSVGALSEALNDLQDRHGEHAALWFDRRTRELRIVAPLPRSALRSPLISDRHGT